MVSGGGLANLLKYTNSEPRLLHVVSHHLYSIEVLFLFHVNMRNVHPNVREVSCSLAHLGEYIASLVYAALSVQ